MQGPRSSHCWSSGPAEPGWRPRLHPRLLSAWLSVCGCAVHCAPGPSTGGLGLHLARFFQVKDRTRPAHHFPCSTGDSHSSVHNTMLRSGVALVTGGTSGLGYAFADALLRWGTQCVVLVDIASSQSALKACAQLKDEYGADKVVHVRGDVSDPSQLRNAFMVASGKVCIADHSSSAAFCLEHSPIFTILTPSPSFPKTRPALRLS